MLNEDEVRRLAHRLWEEEGCPEGRDEEFWYLAEDIIRSGERYRLPSEIMDLMHRILNNEI